MEFVPGVPPTLEAMLDAKFTLVDEPLEPGKTGKRKSEDQAHG